MSKTPLIICLPFNHPTLSIPGSLPVKCSDCPTIVSVAPSSWQILHDHPEAKIVCNVCALAYPVVVNRTMTPSQVDDMLEALKETDH